MTGIEAPLLWLVLAFAGGSDCLLQGSFHQLHDQQAFVREDGCPVKSQQEGDHVVFWSQARWVAIKIPTGARSLSSRWGRTVAHVNGDTVTVQYGTTLDASQSEPALHDRSRMDLLDKWRISNLPAHRWTRRHTVL